MYWGRGELKLQLRKIDDTIVFIVAGGVVTGAFLFLYHTPEACVGRPTKSNESCLPFFPELSPLASLLDSQIQVQQLRLAPRHMPSGGCVNLRLADSLVVRIRHCFGTFWTAKPSYLVVSTPSCFFYRLPPHPTPSIAGTGWWPCATLVLR